MQRIVRRLAAKQPSSRALTLFCALWLTCSAAVIWFLAWRLRDASRLEFELPQRIMRIFSVNEFLLFVLAPTQNLYYASATFFSAANRRQLAALLPPLSISATAAENQRLANEFAPLYVTAFVGTHSTFFTREILIFLAAAARKRLVLFVLYAVCCGLLYGVWCAMHARRLKQRLRSAAMACATQPLPFDVFNVAKDSPIAEGVFRCARCNKPCEIDVIFDRCNGTCVHVACFEVGKSGWNAVAEDHFSVLLAAPGNHVIVRNGSTFFFLRLRRGGRIFFWPWAFVCATALTFIAAEATDFAAHSALWLCSVACDAAILVGISLHRNRPFDGTSSSSLIVTSVAANDVQRCFYFGRGNALLLEAAEGDESPAQTLIEAGAICKRDREVLHAFFHAMQPL